MLVFALVTNHTLFIQRWIQPLIIHVRLHVSVSIIPLHFTFTTISQTELRQLREDVVYFVYGLLLLAGIYIGD
jgi:hypothetical protein